jgi:uncharacterized protein (DUF4415 family)
MRNDAVKDEYDFSKGVRGTIVKAEKAKATLYLDKEVLSVFRERAKREGKGTLINEALRGVIAPEARPVTLETLRRVLRKEFLAAH